MGENTSIEDLNDDCLEHIFKYIPIIYRLGVKIVSKRWRKVSKLAWSNVKSLDLLESSATNDLDEFPPIYRSNIHIGAILKNCGGYLEELKLGNPCTYKILNVVGEYCVNLTRLEIEFERYGKRFTTLFSQMGKLKYFGMRNIERNVDDDFWGDNPPECLNEIHLWGHNLDFYQQNILMVYPSVFPQALQSFTKLSAITLEGFTLTQEMMSLIGFMLQLTFLSLANCRIEGITVYSLTRLKNLEHLNMSGVSKLDDDILIELITNCRNLRYFNLNYCPNISPTGLTGLWNLPHLEELFVNSCDITDSMFIKLQSLKKLECRDCKNVHDSGIIKLMEYASNLEHLNLINTRVSEDILSKAAEITKRRINDSLKLHIIVDKSLKAKWERCEEQVVSHLLVVDVVKDTKDIDVATLIEKYGARHFDCEPEVKRKRLSNSNVDLCSGQLLYSVERNSSCCNLFNVHSEDNESDDVFDCNEDDCSGNDNSTDDDY